MIDNVLLLIRNIHLRFILNVSLNSNVKYGKYCFLNNTHFRVNGKQGRTKNETNVGINKYVPTSLLFVTKSIAD